MSKIVSRFSLVFIAALLISFVSPLTQAFAAGPATNLTIHKITGDTETTATFDQLVNGTAPAGSKPVSGISFTYWKVTDAQLATMKANMSAYDTQAEVEALAGTKTGTSAKTAADGTVKLPSLAEGNYWFIEDPSTAVKDAKAVPFGLQLPITNEAGNGFITDLHVFPKNTLEDTPTIDKDVEKDGNKSSSFNVGDPFNWLIQPTIVKGIDEYTKFEVTDKIDSKLDFAGADKVTVELNGAPLAANAYNATYDAATRTVKVSFTDTGLKTLATAVGGKLNILIPTTINNTAVMGQPITNNATLDFNNGHGISTDNGTTPPTVPPTDLPKVYTGGKNFVKTNGSSEALQGAEFVIKNAAGEFAVQNKATGAITWTADQSAATVFTSGADGKFEVKGLAYGADGSNNTGATDYTLVETKAPAGFTLPTNPETTFNVNATSYYADPTSITTGTAAATAEPQTIINKKTSIPNTGGMGTILFTVVGLGLMVMALILFRRKQRA